MLQFESPAAEIAFYVVAIAAAVMLLVLGFLLGKWVNQLRTNKTMATREQELFTAQRGFKTLYEQELATVKDENAKLKEQVASLNTRVEEYRRKAAGLGGLFSSSSKKNDAMYALLLENEALEEALYAQNEKLKQERTDSLKEQMRATGYRRVLMSQLLNDERIKGYVAEIMADERPLPGPAAAATGDKQLTAPAVDAPVGRAS